MTYELAKKLKDSGFPQSDSNYMFNKDGDIIIHGEDTDCLCPACEGEEFYIIPTLEGLIDACGDEFDKLAPLHLGGKITSWSACYHNDDGDGCQVGKTRKIAVAKLYIKLKS